MLKRIRIRGYKSLYDAEVRLEPLSVLFGPNAAGKSNFLDALQLLSRLATSRTLKEAFEPPYRGQPLDSFSFGRRGLRGLLDRESVSFTIEADIELAPVVIEAVNRQIREMRHRPSAVDSEHGTGKPLASVRERNLRYRIELEMLPQTGFLRVADEYLAALNAEGEPTGKRRPFLERMEDRFHLRMEGQAHPTYYERYLDHTILSLPLYPPHYPHLVAARHELASWLFFYFEPRERMRLPNAVKEVRHVGLMGEELVSFLNTLKALDAPQFRAVEKSLRMLIPSVTGIELEVNRLGEVELQLLEGEMPVPARVLSEGTLRALGLLALGGAKQPPALVGFEEPENGIHPRRIRMITELLRTRAETGDTQLIVTTHSPILPDYVEDRSLLVCRKKEGRTSIEPFSPTWGELGRRDDIDGALDADDESPRVAVSTRILRGDLDG